ncbi:MAG: hypothetical protein M1275_03460 [Patescibacteria group bacterium]|nr:hypothetical protein [Patescibacteria group bacterium]
MIENQNSNPFIIPPENIEEEPRRKTLLDRLNFPRSWLVIIVVAIVVLLAVLASTLFFRSRPNPQPDVALWFSTSGTITSGSASELSLVYENRDSKALSNTSVEIVYPDSFRFLSSEPASADGSGRQFNLADVAVNDSGVIKIVGIFNGSPQEVQMVRGKMFFQQADSSAAFTQSADISLSLEAPDFNLRINAPAQVVMQQRIDYAITFQNISDTDLDRVQIRLTYPNGFKFLTASRPSADSATWEMGSMKIGAQAALDLSGTLAGSPGEDKTLQADVGYLDASGVFVLQSRTFASTKVLASPLTVSVQLAGNDSVNEGDFLHYTINYRNTGDVGMNNVKIVMHLDENSVDYSTLSTSGGALVGKDIIWNPAGVTGLRLLQPGAAGNLTLNFSVKRNLSGSGVRNPKVHSTVVISSNELPEPVDGDEITVKVRSKLTLSASSEYVSGPLPPVTGQSTVFRVKLNVGSTVNEVNDVSFGAVVNIPKVDVVENSWGDSANFYFNQASGRIGWNVGGLSAFGASQVEFLVKVTPSEADRISGMLMLKTLQATGNDGFTGDSISGTSPGDLYLSF